MTTLEILQKKLEKCDKIDLVSYSETRTRYICKIRYDGDYAVIDLPKVCSPASHQKVVIKNIYSAIASIYFNRGNYEKAKEWLCKKIGD